MLDCPWHSRVGSWAACVAERGTVKFTKVGIVYNHRGTEAKAMMRALVERVGLEDRAWVSSTSDLEADMPVVQGTDLIITVGGDGTIIRAARLAVPEGIPILGVNMGRLGFMTELKAEEALDRVPEYLEGTFRIEERYMIQIDLVPPSSAAERGTESAVDGFRYHALNDVVVGRGAVSRLVTIKAYIDGARLTDFRADAVIVSTATGSTGYNLSVGGPILWPEASVIILKSVAPHVGMAPALVLPPAAVLDLTVETDHKASLSVDGYVDIELALGDGIRVQNSPLKARFLRANPPIHFYETLTQRLGFGGGQSSTRAIQY